MTALKLIKYKGFTLIELLVVIAIIGVLAVVVLIAINPVQQLARTRDAGRKSAVTQIGHAMEAYATTNEGSYTTEDATWIQALVDAGEITLIPASITYSTGVGACTNQPVEDWCYDYDPTAGEMIVFATLESTAENARCTADNPLTPQGFFVYSNADGQGGVVCTADDTAMPTVGGNQPFI